MKFLSIILLSFNLIIAGEIKTFTAEPCRYVEKASIHAYYGTSEPSIVLVLCPGVNGDGRGMIEKAIWQKFADTNKIGLVGISFASKGEDLDKCHGYYYPQEGSGNLFFELIDEAYPNKPKVIYYGFSGGAQFAIRFTAWKPERVLAWSACSAGRCDPTPSRNQSNPPGILACGKEDERHSTMLDYFKTGRILDKKWLWVSIPHLKHSPSPSFEDFLRLYFKTIIDGVSEEGVWININEKTLIASDQVSRFKQNSAWLPNEALFEEWIKIHSP